MKNVSVIILAAGQGTRMKSQKPKVLHEICGKSMLYHVISQALKISDNIIIVLGFESELIKTHIAKEFPNEAKICSVLQDTSKFPGTAGAVKSALNLIKNDSVLITCADMPLIDSSELKELCKENSQLVVGGFYLKNPFGYGRIVTKNNKVIKIVEQKDASKKEQNVNFCNSGAYVFKKELLNKILPKIKNNNASKEFYLTDAVQLAIKAGFLVTSKEVNAQNFMGVNDKISLSEAENLMLNKIRQKWQAAGVTMHLPHTIYIDISTQFSGECEIESNCVIKGKSFIKESLIKSGSVIEDSMIEKSDIGPNAHLRPNCKIKNSHIGNFVELKNTILDEVKAGHLSYLGDCEIDKNTNIGCGSITCNYDGLKKHKTKIGKNVFVGSDVSLIAPIEIADNTIIAAGSVVTKSSKKGELVITRAEQKNISGYFDKKFKKK